MAYNTAITFPPAAHDHSREYIQDRALAQVDGTGITKWPSKVGAWRVISPSNLGLPIDALGYGALFTAGRGYAINIYEDANGSLYHGRSGDDYEAPVWKKLLDQNNYNTYAASKDHSHDSYALTNHTHNYAAASHTHDDRYYTEGEVNTKLTGYSTTSHTHNSYASTSHTHPELTREWVQENALRPVDASGITSWPSKVGAYRITDPNAAIKLPSGTNGYGTLFTVGKGYHLTFYNDANNDLWIGRSGDNIEAPTWRKVTGDWILYQSKSNPQTYANGSSDGYFILHSASQHIAHVTAWIQRDSYYSSHCNLPNIGILPDQAFVGITFCKTNQNASDIGICECVTTSRPSIFMGPSDINSENTRLTLPLRFSGTATGQNNIHFCSVTLATS